MNTIRNANYRDIHLFLADVYESFAAHGSWEVLTWLPSKAVERPVVLSIANVDGGDGLGSWETKGVSASDGSLTPPTSFGRQVSCFVAQDGLSGGSMEQSVALPASSWTGIDEGRGVLDVAFLSSYKGSGNGRMDVTFLDSQRGTLHSAIPRHIAQEPSPEQWSLRSYKIPVPQEARSVIMRIHFFREGGPPWGFFVRAIRGLVTFPPREQSLLRMRNLHWHFWLEIESHKTKKEISLSLSPEQEDGGKIPCAKVPLSANFTSHFVLSDGHCCVALHLGGRRFASVYAGGLRPTVPWTVVPLYLGSSVAVGQVIRGSCVRPEKGYVWMGNSWNEKISVWPWNPEDLGSFRTMLVGQDDAIPLFPTTVLLEKDGRKQAIGQLREISGAPVSSNRGFSLRSTDGGGRFFPEEHGGFVIPENIT